MNRKINVIAKKEENLSILESILKSRNITDIKAYMNPEDKDLSSPYVFSDMEKAVTIINNAIKNNDKILIWGDFDADGVTSCAILYKTLRVLGANVEYFLPDRILHGHGINLKELLKLKAKDKIKLIITVDCGISNIKEIELIKTMGTKTIITDHHEQGEILPAADCIINPNADNSLDENLKVDEIKKVSYLSGAGVSLFLSLALLDSGFDELKKELIAISAIGTISDVVPLEGDNRIIAAKGLKYINEKENKGVDKLFEKQNISKKITSEDIAFILTPRINAAGRLDKPDEALNLLIEQDDFKLDMIIEKLDNLNKIRQNLCDKTYLEAVNSVIPSDDCIALYNENWHIGIIGIVASKLVEKFHLPVFLMTKDDNNMLRCSIRGTKQYNIAEILSQMKNYFAGFGGHKMAGGFSADLNSTDVETIINQIKLTVSDNKDDSVDENSITVDMELNADDVNSDLIEDLECMQPFGAGNPQPVFLFKDALLVSKRTIGKEQNHLSLTLQKDSKNFCALWWKHSTTSINENETTDIIFKPEINEYNGEKKIQLIIQTLPDDINEQVFIRSVKLYDHRQKEGILDKINSYVENKGGSVKIYATTINTKKEFANFPSLKNNIISTLTPQKSLMLFDYPTDEDGFRELISKTKPLQLHLMKNKFSKNPDDYISQICGMIKFAFNNKEGSIDTKTIADNTGLNEAAVVIMLELLEKIESIQIVNEAKINYIKAPNHEAIHNDSMFENFMIELERINNFKEYLLTADIDSIREMTNA